MNQNAYFVELIKNSMMPSTGCTEPVAIALNTATARKHAQGSFVKLILTLDPYLYKNAIGVGIPGSDERGIALCAALGVTAGNADAKMNVLGEVSEAALLKAKQLQLDVEVRVLPSGSTLFIQSEFYTDTDAVRVITLNEHANIVDIAHAPFPPFEYKDEPLGETEIQSYTLKEFIVFADTVAIEDLAFLKEGLEMNRNIAAEGMSFGLGAQLESLLEQGLLSDSPATAAKRLTAAGSFARMSGISLPVMTATGSGNQGITLFLTIDAVAEKLNAAPEKELRAIALAALVNIFGKSYIGALSAICACGVASGLGASIGICYLLGGGENEMLGAARNVLGAISGMVCDGAKEGCAHKVELSAGLAVEAAMLSIAGRDVSGQDGILAEDLGGLFSNLGYLVNTGMAKTNEAIVEIMTRK